MNDKADAGLSPPSTPASVLTSGGAASFSIWNRLRLGWLAHIFRSLRHRNYRLYFFGQLVSLTGTWMQTAAMAWLAFNLTSLSRWPAWISACQFLPTFVLGLVGGRLADRLPKRTVLICTQSALLVLAFALTAVVAAGLATPRLLVTISALNGLVLAFDLPARLAFVTDMVGREDVINAVGLNSVLFNSARIVGPAIAGVLLRFWSPSACFLANALSYVAVVWALTRMDVGLAAAPRVHGRSSRSLRGGVRYLAERPRLAALTLIAGVISICAWPVLSLLPGFAVRILHNPEVGYTTMLTAVGIGALAAAATVAGFASEARQRILINSGLVAVTISLMILSFSTRLYEAVGCCVLLGFGLILFLATSQALVQLSAGDHNRGLIMGVWAMVQSGGLPLGNLIAGPAADHFGERLTLLGCAGLCGASAIAILARFGWWAGDESRNGGSEPAALPSV